VPSCMLVSVPFRGALKRIRELFDRRAASP
jgi:hypothetical protein